MKKKLEAVEQFLRKYHSSYQANFENVSFAMKTYRHDHQYLPGYLQEIYDYFGILNQDANIYEDFANYILNIDEVEKIKTFVEVNAGQLARVGVRLKKVLGPRSNIVVYDSNLLADDSLKDLELVKRDLSSMSLYTDTQFSSMSQRRKTIQMELYGQAFAKPSLVYSLYPCEEAIPLVNLACHNKTNFIMGLCNSDHLVDAFSDNEDLETYRSSLRREINEILKEHDNGVLVETELKGKSKIKVPIWYNRK